MPTFQCVSEEKVVIDCNQWPIIPPPIVPTIMPSIKPTTEPPNYWPFIIVVVIILLLLTIIGCLICWTCDWQRVKDYLWPPKQEPKSSTFSLSTVNSSKVTPSVHTVDSIDGKTLKKEETREKCKNKFQLI